MILTHLGLTAQERKDVHNAVGRSYRAKTRVQLLNLDRDHLDDISAYLTDGQVDGDYGQAVARTASLTFTDPHNDLPFDADDPSAVALDLRRILRVVWELYIDEWSDWVSIPVFTGPVSNVVADGDQTVVSCQDMAVFGMAACWQPLHIHRHTKKTDAITTLLTERAGAPNHELDLPDLDARLPHPISLHRQARPWLVARRIANGMDRQLFYDGAGICRLRHHPTQSRFSFTGSGHVTEPIQVTWDEAQLVNAVYVTGAQPKGPKSQVTAEAVAEAKHRFSPANIGRNGAPRHLASFVDDSTLKTKAEAQKRADRLLAEGLTQSVDVAFSCLPVPFLDLGDMCLVHTDRGDVTFRLKTFSLPLLIGDGTGDGTSMTVGVRKRLTRSHPKHHKHHHHRRRR